MRIEEIKDVLDKYSTLESHMKKIIKDTFDDHISYINSIELNDKGGLTVSYVYTCRGCHDNDWCTIPAEWLQEGFDYKASWQKAMEDAEARAKEVAKKQAEKDAAKKERKELAELARLKAKYLDT